MKLNNIVGAIALLLLCTLITQSCIDLGTVTIRGNMELNGAEFTIIDNSEISETFGDLISSSDRTSVEVDDNGDFEVVFRPSGSLTEFTTYRYGVLRSTSPEIPIALETGEEIDLGVLSIPEPVQVK